MAKEQLHNAKDGSATESMLKALQHKAHEREKVAKRYQEMAEDLNSKLIHANKKIAAQMEHI